MQIDLIKAKESLTKILSSKDIKATVCEYVMLFSFIKIEVEYFCMCCSAKLVVLDNAVTGDGWKQRT